VKRGLCALLLILALVPSGYMAWTYRAMPHFGHYHDDAVLYVSAKGLAEGRGYRILSFPGEPAQTKYPPGLPLLLAGVWTAVPEFPANLRVATVVCWLWLPLLLGLLWRLYGRWGISHRWRVVLLAFIALNLYVAIFANSITTDLPFTCFIVAVLLLADSAERRGRWTWWAAAGACGAAAFLVRTAAVALLAVPLAVWVRRRDVRVLVFAGAMAPAVIAWVLWTSANRAAPADYATLYYTDYVRDLLQNVNASNFHLFLWRNVDAFLAGAGSLFVPGLEKGIMGRMALYTVAVLAIAGTVRFCRRVPGAATYGAFAIAYAALVIAWCYPPNERFVLPVFPLLLAGLREEAVRFRSVLTTSWKTSRAAAVVTAGVLLAAAGFGVTYHVRSWTTILPAFYRGYERMHAIHAQCFDVLRELPAGSGIVSWHEGPVFLHTGQPGVPVMVPPALIYEEREEDIVRLLSSQADIARKRGLKYVFEDLGYARDFTPELYERVAKRLESDASLEQVATCGSGRVWKVKP
jgi:hypothetical protein